MLEHGYSVVHEERNNYNIGKRFGISDSEAMVVAETFNRSRHIEYLQPHKDAVEYTQKLHDLGFQFIVITGFTDDPGARRHREINLLNNFGPIFSELHCMSLRNHESKELLLSEWRDSGLYWIEDHAKNAVTGARLGLKTILIDQLYNRTLSEEDESLVKRTKLSNPWEQIYFRVTKDYFRTVELP